MKKFLLSTALLSMFAQPAFAATGQANTSAIVMFLLFIAGTMVITWWAARKTQTTSDFYTAGGGISGFQNGLAIAGDYISAASFLGIAVWCTSVVLTASFTPLVSSLVGRW